MTNPISLNGYNYANNNPVMNIDPDGKNPILIQLLRVVVIPILVQLAKKYGPKLLKELNDIVKDKIYPHLKKYIKEYDLRFGQGGAVFKILKKSGSGDTRIFSFDYHSLRLTKNGKMEDRKVWHYHLSNPSMHYVFRWNDEYAKGYSLPSSKWYMWVW